MKPIILIVMSMALGATSLHAAEMNTLPLRGERLVSAMMKEEGPPALLDMSVSPTGDYAFVASARAVAGERSKVGIGYAPKQWQFWLIDARSGRRVELQGLAQDISAYRIFSLGAGSAYQHHGAIAPQWSSDARQIALLERLGADLTVLIWDVAQPGAPVRVSLPSVTKRASETGLQLRQWAWWSRKNELLLEWSDPPEDFDQLVKRVSQPPAQDRLSWAWVRSEALQTQKRPDVWGELETVANRPTMRAVVDLRKGQVRRLSATEGQRPGRHTWVAGAGGTGVVFSTMDVRKSFNEPMAGFQLWLLRQGDVRARDIVDMKNTIVRIDSESRAPRVIHSGGAGEIGSVIELSKGKYAVIEQAPDLATWPMHAAFGRLRVITPEGGERVIPGEPLTLRGQLFNTSDPNRLLFWERWGGRLFEIDLTSGSRELLTPAGMSATSVSVSSDGRTVGAVLEAIGTPPEAALWSRDTSSWKMLTHFGESYRPLEGQGTSTWFTWRSKDDQFDMDGIVVKPPGFDPKTPRPLIVCLNGGNTFGTVANTNTFVDALELGWAAGCNHAVAEAGYMLFIPNHRQVSDKGYRENLAVIGRYGDQVTLDIEAGVDALIAKGWVSPDRIGVASSSHGGDELIFALANSSRYRAAIVDDMPEMLHELHSPHSHLHFGARWQFVPSDREFMTAIMGFDPVQRPWADVFAIRTPLLLRWSGLQRSTDLLDINMMSGNTAVSMRTQTAKLSYALESNGVPFEVIVDRDGHGISTPKYLIELQSRALQWFDYFILGKGVNPLPAMPSPLDYSEEFEQKVTSPPGYAAEPHWAFVQREWQERNERENRERRQ